MSDKKYAPRALPNFSSASNSESDWMNEFTKNLEKQSVESRSKSSNSIYEQINAIMGGKPKYSSVAQAVEDMKERSGMTSFLNKMQARANEESVKKKANAKVFETNPQIKDTVDNYITDTRGNLPIPAVVERIKGIHHNDVADDSAWDDEEFLHYINNKSIEENKKHPNSDNTSSNLGKINNFADDDLDPSNMDAFHSLNPANT